MEISRTGFETNLDSNKTPKTESELMAVGVRPDIAARAEDVRTAASIKDALGFEDVMAAIDADEGAKAKMVEGMEIKRRQLDEVTKGVELLEEKELVENSMVAQARALLGVDADLIEAVQTKVGEVQGELVTRLKQAEAKWEERLAEIDVERSRKRAELQAAIEARPEARAGRGMKEDVRLANELVKIIANPDLASALERFNQDLGGTGMGETVMKGATRSEKTAQERAELAEVMTDGRRRINEEAEVARKEAGMKLAEERKLIEAEARQEGERLNQRRVLYEERTAEHTGLLMKHTEALTGVTSELENKSVVAISLQEELDEDDKGLRSLEKSITDKTSLVGELGEAMALNAERLATQGREVLTVVGILVDGLNADFEKGVETQLTSVAEKHRTGLELWRNKLVVVREAAGKAKAFLEKELVGRLIETSLYKIGEDGQIETVVTKGLDMILIEDEKRVEAKAAIEAHRASLEAISKAVDLSTEVGRAEVGELNLERTTADAEIEEGAEPMRTKFAAARASMEMVGALLPSVEVVPDQPTVERVAQPRTATLLKAIGGMLGKLFGKRK